jgi:hypothetical protein
MAKVYSALFGLTLFWGNHFFLYLRKSAKSAGEISADLLRHEQKCSLAKNERQIGCYTQKTGSV